MPGRSGAVHHLHSSWDGDCGLDRTVLLAFVANFDWAQRCRVAAFNPFQPSKVWNNFNPLESRFNRFNAEHGLAQPRCWTGGPPVAKAVTKSQITVSAVIAVQIPFA